MTPLALPILILAAGASSRMRGADKLLETVGPETLLANRIGTALATGQPVIVTLPPRDLAQERWDEVGERPVAAVEVPDPSAGMAQSIAFGVSALPEGAVGVMILPADLPDITAADMRHMLSEFDGDSILRATSAQGQPGHPVVFAARDFASLRSLEGDEGARSIISENIDRLRAVSLPHDHARRDLDTPEDWAAWRAEKGL